MKRTKLLFSIFTILLATIATSCDKNCICKYYKNDKFYDIKEWDNDNITKEDCEGMNETKDISVPLQDNINYEIVKYEVVCKQK